MIQVEFSTTSQTAATAIALTSFELVLRRGSSQTSRPQKINPWATCVMLYGSKRCWEQCDDHTSLIHGHQCPHAHHHRRPSMRRAIMVAMRIPVVAISA